MTDIGEFAGEVPGAPADDELLCPDGLAAAWGDLSDLRGLSEQALKTIAIKPIAVVQRKKRRMTIMKLKPNVLN